MHIYIYIFVKRDSYKINGYLRFTHRNSSESIYGRFGVSAVVAVSAALKTGPGMGNSLNPRIFCAFMHLSARKSTEIRCLCGLGGLIFVMGPHCHERQGPEINGIEREWTELSGIGRNLWGIRSFCGFEAFSDPNAPHRVWPASEIKTESNGIERNDSRELPPAVSLIFGQDFLPQNPQKREKRKRTESEKEWTESNGMLRTRTKRLIDWLIDWLTDWLIDWKIQRENNIREREKKKNRKRKREREREKERERDREREREIEREREREREWERERYIYIYICCKVKNWSNFCPF